MPLLFPLFLSMHLYVFICFFLRVLLALYAHFLFHIFFCLSVCFGLYLSLSQLSRTCVNLLHCEQRRYFILEQVREAGGNRCTGI